MNFFLSIIILMTNHLSIFVGITFTLFLFLYYKDFIINNYEVIMYYILHINISQFLSFYYISSVIFFYYFLNILLNLTITSFVIDSRVIYYFNHLYYFLSITYILLFLIFRNHPLYNTLFHVFFVISNFFIIYIFISIYFKLNNIIFISFYNTFNPYNRISLFFDYKFNIYISISLFISSYIMYLFSLYDSVFPLYFSQNLILLFYFLVIHYFSLVNTLVVY